MSEPFDCHHCKESLYGRKYILSGEQPHCIPCYDTIFANTCDECKEPIGHEARVRHSLGLRGRAELG
uniref:FHL1/2/3/5 N-terminal LIM domain-containing protein n=1 Tax=Callorhinchus milii TaxID=7868 RepID=A0A4W3GHI7_CALMI